MARQKTHTRNVKTKTGIKKITISQYAQKKPSKKK